jgi:hypothetical protein
MEISETLGLMSVHHSLRALEESVESGYPDRVDLGELVRGEGLATEGHSDEVAVQRSLIERMIGTLVQLTGRPASARLGRSPSSPDNRSLTISATDTRSGTGPFTGDLTADGTDAGLLQAYLIAWHHGGSIEATNGEGESTFTVLLPKDPAAVVLPNPDEDWLAEQFCMFEN